MHKGLQTITSRISLLIIYDPITQAPLHEEQLKIIGHDLKSRHGKYFHVFNLTSTKVERFGDPTIRSVNFKWRGIPFSMTEAIKILTAMDTYMRCNIANSIVFLVPDEASASFCKFIIQAYCHLLTSGMKKDMVPKKLVNFTNFDNLLSEFQGIYQDCQIKNPPIKIIESIQFISQTQNQPFIPIYEILNQFRHNSFEAVYRHDIESSLIDYYLQLKSPLKSGIGSKFCDKKPETKYLTRPCLVIGDVKIVFYSFEKLVRKPEFVIGFNTKGLECDQSAVILEAGDWYLSDLSEIEKYKGVLLKIELADYCQLCKNQANCEDCQEKIKKISQRYNQTQTDLQKLKRKRTVKQVECLLSL